MQTSSTGKTGGSVRRRNSLAFSALAVLVLSLGVGTATAAFSVIDGMVPHESPYPTCDTAASFGGDRFVMVGLAGGPMLRDRVTDAYQSGIDAAGDGLETWTDVAFSLADRSTIIVLSAGALALLVACANAARSLYARSGLRSSGAGTERVALAAIGALSIAALLLHVASMTSLADLSGSFPLARIDARAIGFAICVSALVEARRRLLPRLT